MTPHHPEGFHPEVICPYCLDTVTYDEDQLYLRNAVEEYERLDLSAEHHDKPNDKRIEDIKRGAFQRCPHAGPVPPHYLPVPYLVNGEPLTVAMVGSSYAGKTHLLAAMLGEVERGGLKRYGLSWDPLNPDWHRHFVRERIDRLHEGEVLSRTPSASFVHFADALLLSGRGWKRPVVFFDLAGEDLVEHGEANRFLTGVGAFIFVVDPLRALRLPELEPLREHTRIHERGLGDEAFAAVLARVPRTGEYLGTPAAVVVNKSDLVRFTEPVSRWLRRPPSATLTSRELREESRDVYAFLRQYGSSAWLRPFDECARCTLHFVSATGGREQGAVFPNGVTPRRVLTPLLSILAMSGFLTGADLREAGL